MAVMMESPVRNDNLLKYRMPDRTPLSGWAIACFASGIIGPFLTTFMAYRLVEFIMHLLDDSKLDGSLAIVQIGLFSPFIVCVISAGMAIFHIRLGRRRGTGLVIAGLVFGTSLLILYICNIL
jgi:hypothetical protein